MRAFAKKLAKRSLPKDRGASVPFTSCGYVAIKLIAAWPILRQIIADRETASNPAIATNPLTSRGRLGKDCIS